MGLPGRSLKERNRECTGYPFRLFILYVIYDIDTLLLLTPSCLTIEVGNNRKYLPL